MPGSEGDWMNEVELKLLPCRRDDIKFIAFLAFMLVKREVEFCHMTVKPCGRLHTVKQKKTWEPAPAPDPKPDSLRDQNRRVLAGNESRADRQASE